MHPQRIGIAAALLLTTGCTGNPPTADPDTEVASTHEVFLSQVRDIGGDLTDQQLITAAQDACYEMELHVKTRRDLRLFVKVFTAREVVPAGASMFFLGNAMKAYCPDLSRFRPPAPDNDLDT